MKTDKSYQGSLTVIGETIEMIRLQKRITVKQMADKLSIDHSTYRNIERGKSDINLTRLLRIAEVFGISVVGLLTEL
jgi:transcriptional regulator with XRE-family HTH domain